MPVMNRLFHMILYSKKHINETKEKFKISAQFVNACRRKVQKMDGRRDIRMGAG